MALIFRRLSPAFYLMTAFSAFNSHWQRAAISERLDRLTTLPHALGFISADLPVLRLRYEVMKTDSVSCFRQVLQFVGWPVDEARLAKAVQACSFQQLQVHEKAQGFRERLASATAGFLRQGTSERWRTALTDAQMQRIEDCHGQVIRQLGYLEPKV
jgi:hypothetical protein